MNNRKNMIKGIVSIMVVAYGIVAILFVVNITSLSSSYKKTELKYAHEVELAMREAFDQFESSEELDQLVKQYPMELNLIYEGKAFYQTVSQTNLNLLFGVVNRDAIVQEAQFTYTVDGKEMDVWYTLYRMPEKYFLKKFLATQMTLLLISFILATISILLIQRILYLPLKQVKESIERANHYDFNENLEATDEVNKSFGQFAHKVENTIHAVSRKNTALETELQRERERLNNTIMVARSLVHDLKSPVHQNLIENELELDKHVDVPSTNLLAQKNIQLNDRVLRSINETLAIMKEDIYQVVQQKSMVNLEALYSDTLRMYQAQMQEKGLIMDVALDEIEVVCNQAGIQLLIHNLISNMIQYASRGSTLLIDVMVEENQIILRHSNTADRKDIERMKKTEQLFNVVQTEQSSTNVYSSGNGLFLIKDLASLMNGEYSLHVHDDQVEVVVTLPQGGKV